MNPVLFVFLFLTSHSITILGTLKLNVLNVSIIVKC